MRHFHLFFARNLKVKKKVWSNLQIYQLVRSCSSLLNGLDQAKHAAILEQFNGGGAICLEKDESTGIATLLINNPQKKNALSGKMMVDFYNHMNELERWTTGKAVVLSGAGGTFCSGGDLETIFRLDKVNASSMCRFMHTLTTRLFNLPLVSVAAINGHAVGGGAELATACDFRIMTSKAKIGFVQAKLNVSPGWGGGTRLVKLVGRTTAMHLLVSGSVLDANKALNCGLVDEIVIEEGHIAIHGQEWLKKHLAGNVDSTRALKTIVATASDADMETSLNTERKQLMQLWGTPSHTEAREKKLKHK